MDNLVKFKITHEDIRTLDETASNLPPRMEWQLWLYDPPYLTEKGWQPSSGYRIIWRGQRKPSAQLLNAMDYAMRNVVLWMRGYLQNQNVDLSWPALPKEVELSEEEEEEVTQ